MNISKVHRYFKQCWSRKKGVVFFLFPLFLFESKSAVEKLLLFPFLSVPPFVFTSSPFSLSALLFVEDFRNIESSI